MYNNIIKLSVIRQHSNTAVGGVQVITQAASYLMSNTAVGGVQVITQAASYLMFRSIQNSCQSC